MRIFLLFCLLFSNQAFSCPYCIFLKNIQKVVTLTSVHSVDFLVGPLGTVYPVPEGAVGPIPWYNPKGKLTGVFFINEKKKKGASTIRLMEAIPERGNYPAYPNGYIKYENHLSQGLDPYTERTVSNSQSHFNIE